MKTTFEDKEWCLLTEEKAQCMASHKQVISQNTVNSLAPEERPGYCLPPLHALMFTPLHPHSSPRTDWRASPTALRAKPTP